MNHFTLILIWIFVPALISAQGNNIKLADHYFEAGNAFAGKGSIKLKAGFDSSFSQTNIDVRMLDSSNFYYNIAELIYKKEKIWPKYMDCIERQSRNLFKLKLADSAIAISEKGLREVETNSHNHLPEFHKSYFILSSYYFNHKSDYNTAINLCKYSIKLARNTLPKSSKFLAIYYTSLGMYYTFKEQYDSSMYYYQFILDSLNSDGHPSEYPIHNVYQKISKNYEAQGNYDQAIEFLEKAVEYFLKNNQNRAAGFLGGYKNDLGILYQKKGDYDKALECYIESINLNLKPLGENNTILATTYNNIGTIYIEKGDYEKALEYLNKCLYCHLNSFGNKHAILITDYTNLSYAYYYLNNMQASVQCIQQALEVSKKSLPENHPRNFLLYRDAAFIISKAHQFKDALTYINKCNEFIAKNDSDKNHDPEKAENYKTLGTYYYENNEYGKAFEYFKTALNLMASFFGNKNTSIIKLNNILGDICIRQNNFERAVEYYNSALKSNNVEMTKVSTNELFSNARSEYDLFQSLKGKAYALRHCYAYSKDLETLKLAFNTNQACIDLFNKLKYSFKSDLSKIYLTETSYDIFEMGIAIALELSKYQNYNYYKNIAFNIAEKSKNGILQSAISETKAKQYAGVPDSILNIEEGLKKGIENFDILISQELEKDKPDSLKISYWQNKLFSIKEKFLNFIKNLEVKFPRYHNLKFNSHSISVSEIQKIINNKTSVVEFFKGNNSISIFIVSKDTFEVTTVQIDSNFNETITNLYKVLLKQTNLIQKKNHTQFVQYDSDVYNYIIAPIYNKISKSEHLVIIPDGNLYYIPFELLMAKPDKPGNFSEYNYLIKKFEVTYHYSSTLCFEKDSLSEKNYNSYFTGFAPMFNDSTELQFLSLYRKSNLNYKSSLNSNISRLIFAEEEVKSIYKLFNGKEKSSFIYLDKNATESVFKNTTEKALSRILHIATHGIANETRPSLSALLFSQYPDNSTNDNVLFAEEIINMQINSELVVLSACESGIGKLIKGEGMMALNRSFLYAGVRKLMFSLWKVNDKETCNLMIEFYKRILEGQPYRTALRNAKLKMLSNPISSIPNTWSSFILIDN